MKQWLYTLIGFLTLSFSLSAQETAEMMAPPLTIQADSSKSLLWEINGKGLKNPSYLFGTIHMIGKEDFILTEITRNSFAKADRVTFEINMEDMMDISVLMPIMMKAMMNNNTTLKDLLSAEDYKLVQEHFDKMGLPLMFMERIKPMFLSALTGSELPANGMSTGEVVSYEMELMTLAQSQEKEIGGLETAEFQMGLFDSIPYNVQAEMLVNGIKSGQSGDDQFKVMVDLYKNQDIEGMQDLIGQDSEGISKYENLLLLNRNRNWIPVMRNMMKEKVTFFAVGAGHLGGPEGVIALLRKEGYTLTPLK